MESEAPARPTSSTLFPPLRRLENLSERTNLAGPYARTYADLYRAGDQMVFSDVGDEIFDMAIYDSTQPENYHALPREPRPLNTSSCSTHLATYFKIPSNAFSSKTSRLGQADILSELSMLQSRCAALQHLLLGGAPSTPLGYQGDNDTQHHYIPAGDALPVSVAVCHADICSYFCAQGTGAWSTISPGAHDDSPHTLLSQPHLDHTTSTMDATHAQGTIPYQVSSQLNLDAHVSNADSLQSEFQDIFDFNMASATTDYDIIDPYTTGDLLTNTDHHGAVANATTTSGLLSAGIPPATSVAVAATTNAPRRHRCHNCMKTFRRKGDRDRHALSHDPNATRFPCPSPGCPRVGRRGFLRRDKLTQHQAHMNH